MDRVRHKEANRFKFIPFSERISNVRIDVFHRVPHRFEEESAEKFTYFHLALQKWTVLNLTEKWKAFRKEIGNETQTLPQLINNKEKIINVFLKNIHLQNELSLQPVLELIVALVKDLRYEFYPFYFQVVKELIYLLKYKDPDVLESTFTCLAYIFKYLSRELLKDLDKVLLDLATLLNENNPEYVRDFAAQSFSFVARKVKDKNKFLSLVLYAMQTSPQVSAGCGQLLFEMMKGIKGQTHSCAEELFLVMLESLGKDEIPQKTLFSLTSHVVTAYGNNISPQHSILFNVLLKALQSKLENENHKGLKKLLRIVKLGLNCKKGAHLNDSCLPQMVSLLIKLLSFETEIQKLVAGICADMLNLQNCKLPQEFASRIINKVMQIPEASVILDFVDETSNSTSFEALILPRSLQYFASLDCSEFLQILTKIVVSKTSETSKTLNRFQIYKLTLQSSTSRIFTFLTSILRNYDGDGESSDSKNILCSLILLRHFDHVERPSTVDMVVDIVDKFIELLKVSSDNLENRLFTLCVGLETLLYFKREFGSLKKIINPIRFSEVIVKYLKTQDSVLALKSLDLFLTLSDDFECSDNCFNDLFESVQKWLLSQQSNYRLLSLHVLQQLEKSKSKVVSNLMVNVLQNALDAEIVPLTINDYREKIKLLEKLRYESLELLEEDKYKIVLKYLLGILYCNFKLLWGPIAEIISSYSFGMRANSFWEVFFPHLITATENCKTAAAEQNFHLPNFDDYLISSLSFIKADDKVNHDNYRLLLWTTMNLFPDLCETKNRDVISIFINFIENEILKSSIDHNLTINIQQIDSNKVPLNESQDILVEDVEDNAKSKSSYSDVVKCAVAQLNLFSKFKNPKQCYRESDLRHYYLELFLHKDLDIQKKALECLLTYKFIYLTPYKQNLRNLIDDVKFKDEIVHFQIDTESGIVKDIHREELMPLVMKILYGKMLSRSPTQRGNKGSANLLRRSIIMRFLAGSSHAEMKLFLEMAFKSWNKYCEEDEFPFAKIIESVDLEKVPPLKKLQSAVNLAEVILNSFGGLMSDALQRYILKVLLSIGSYGCGIFAKREKIHSGYLPSLKNLRNTCLDSITKFFDRFQRFPWKEDEINALFHIFIWPILQKLPTEGVYSPTALLRLFSVWSQNPRYFKLLARYHQADESTTPLPFLFELLLNEKCHQSVTNRIGTILGNLLTLREEEPMDVDDEEFEEPVPLTVSFILQVDESGIAKLKLKDELNYGSKILFPHVGSILTYLRRRLEKSEFSLPGKEQVTVLSRITEMASSPEHGDALLSMLIKLLSIKKQMGDDDVMVNVISTIDNLVKIVPKPSSYLRSLAVLFGTVELVQARKILVNLIGNVVKRCPELSQVAIIVRELNAWDWRWVDQPNFDKRLDAFKKIKVLLEEDNLIIDLAFIVLHNCFFFVRCETDLSLRDSAFFCLKDMCPKVSRSKKIRASQKQQWIESILNLTKKGIVSENENVQTLSISLLGVMARECGDLHPVLKDLSLLTNKLDPEVDFFENAQHLQIYRRLRALQKFSSVAKTLKKSFLTRTLVQFILPLASRYLACAKYSDKNSLIDSAIEAVGAVCKFLPWQQYQTVLRFYLTKLRTKLEFQKQLTRTVVAILDSFHFDISKSFPDVKPEIEDESVPVMQPETEKKRDEKEKEKEILEKVEDEKDDVIDEENDDEGKTANDSSQVKESEKDDLVGEDLVEVLEKENEEDIEEEQEGEKELENDKFAIDSIVILNPTAALKVEKAISGHFLEQLYKIISQKSQVESTHKLNYKTLGPDKDDEDILKVPVAVTLVKLLQKLPERILDTQLPGIFMRLCTFLKSRVESVRRVTRETLQQILFSLGPKYLTLLLEEMSASLTKGFQVHVLVYTIHAVIQHIQDLLRPGDIDANLPVLLEICKSDLFGNLSEEKSVPQLQAQHKETKATKSYHLIHLIARCLTEKCLTDLILPVKEVLQNSYTHKNLMKCREFLRQVTQGLAVNRFISNESLFIYVYGTTSESIPQLMPDPPEPPKKKNPKEKQDCFIIPPEPKTRMGVSSNPVKKNARAKAHVIIEFGFSLLHTLLKKDKLKNNDQDIRSYLDPIAPVLVKALESQHVKVSTLALQCFSKAVKYNLPNIKSEVKKITDCLFLILHKYAAAGLCKGDNFDLVMAAFKAVSTLIRETDYHGITTEQLKILLLYTEQDIYDTTRQATAFTLLKTILRKKLNSPELHELMKKVATLSITSELPHIRLQSRQNVLQYIMNYPLNSKLEEFIGFFISQLNFEVESGRQSTLEMIQSFITSFPQNVLEEHSGVFLLTLGARLLNDDSTNCKKMISGVIKAMLARLDAKHRDQLFEILIVWLQGKKLTHKQLAAQVAGIFVSTEKAEFDNRLPKLLPLLQKQFVGDSHPGQFVKVSKNDEEDRLRDHHFFQILQLLLKICTHYPDFLTSEKYQENVYFFSEISQSLLCHAHEWVRLAASQFLGHIFNVCEPADVAAVLNSKNVKSKISFLEPVTIHRRIKSLILDHTAQFVPGVELGQEFLDQIIKNLVYFARVLKDVKNKNLIETKDNEEEEEEEDNNDDDLEKPTLSLLWLIKRMRRIINMELGQCPSSNFLRTAVIRWIGAIALCIPRSDLKPVLYHVMAPIVREREIIDMETKESSMKPLVMEVSAVLKKKIGVEEYSREAIKIRSKLMEKRIQRRNQRAQEFILDPERAAKRRIDRQIRKKEARKRKLEQLKGKKGNKFKKRKKNDYDDDI